MQARSIVEETLEDVERFRVLCVGKSGVGKSSLINRVFRLENTPDAAPVEQWAPGHAEIDNEFTSLENNYFILHDSKGFEAGNTQTFDVVGRFIRGRCDSNLPLKDQLHAMWLCTETPRAGGRFEAGDEMLLRLAHETRIPVVIVFTKYDLSVRTKRDELQEEDSSLSGDVLRKRSKEMVQGAINECIQALEHTLRATNTPRPHHVNVSARQGYEASISSLVQVTCNLVSDSEKLKLMWAIAQRASRQVKISASVDIAIGYIFPRGRRAHGVQPMSLRVCLRRVHEDVVTCWNIMSEDTTLSSDEFKQLILYVIQDVQESQNHDGPHVTPPLAIDKITTFLKTVRSTSVPSNMAVISLRSPFEDWLSSAFLDNGPQVQRLLMAYTTDLITVLKSLSDVVRPSSSEGTMWSELSGVFRAYERLDPRQQIHRRICAHFRHNRQISDVESFRHELRELLEGEPPPSSLERSGTLGRMDPPYALPGPSRSPEDPPAPPKDPEAPPEDPPGPPEDPPPEDPPPEDPPAPGSWWHCFFPCLAPT